MAGMLHKVGYLFGGYWEAAHAIRRQYHPQAIRATQDARLRHLVRYSFDHIKYYREAFQRAGVRPEQIESIDDLHRLPLLTKHELRNQFWDFLPRDLPACRVTRTSGSSGTPVCIFADWHSRRMNSAATIRFFRAVGMPVAGHAILTLLKTEQEGARASHWVVAQGLCRKYYLNPHVTSRANREYAGALIARLGRPSLTGIASALRAFARGVRDGVFPSFTPARIISGGELLLPEGRELIESTFQTRVLDIYACNETRTIAWQCGDGGYHINADNVIVEIVRDGRPVPDGEMGEVVLTDLNRHVMPIIRYRNGDMARRMAGFCSCRCKLPLLAEIIGRTGENVRLPDGRVVLWNLLKSHMTHPGIRQFQLVQVRDGALIVKYVPEPGSEVTQTDALLERRFRDLLGDAIPVRMEHVERIEPAPSGKTSLVISHYVPPAEQAETCE